MSSSFSCEKNTTYTILPFKQGLTVQKYITANDN